MSDPNTEATPSEKEDAANAVCDVMVAHGLKSNGMFPGEAATAALNAAYAIRLPPLYAELELAERRNIPHPLGVEYVNHLEIKLERYREALERIVKWCWWDAEAEEVARQALEEQSE